MEIEAVEDQEDVVGKVRTVEIVVIWDISVDGPLKTSRGQKTRLPAVVCSG
jgi:hypothetical protein